MTGFTFRFSALLQYRRYRRDLLHSVFAQVLAQKATVEQQRTALQEQRRNQIEEMRAITRDGTVDVDATATRRFHAGRLTRDEADADRQIHLIGLQLQACRNAIVIAEQDVEVLERLQTKQQAVFEFEQRKREQRELDDVWLSAHAGEFAR